MHSDRAQVTRIPVTAATGVPTAGTYPFMLGPGRWSIAAFFRGTSATITINSLGETGVAIAAYPIINMTAGAVSPTVGALAVAAPAVINTVGSYGGTLATSYIGINDAFVPVIRDINVVIASPSGAGEIVLVFTKETS